jgi:MEMO1 family protein
MKNRGWQLGRDVAIVVSTDGVHYGADFKHVPYGAGGIEAFTKALAFDRALVRGTLSGPLSRDKPRRFFSTVVDAERPDTYLVPWCGRFSVPLGTMLIEATARNLGIGAPRAVPIALGVSVDTPELAVRDVGMGPTAPANLYHFVTHPAVAFVGEK